MKKVKRGQGLKRAGLGGNLKRAAETMSTERSLLNLNLHKKREPA